MLTIYGIKQSSRQLYFSFHQTIIFISFDIPDECHCVYFKQSRRSFLILSLYVDDIFLVMKDFKITIVTKEWSYTFDIKDMEELNYVLIFKILKDHFRKLLSLYEKNTLR